MSWLNSTLSLGGSNLLGGLSGGYNATNTPTSTLTPEQNEYLKKILPMLYGGASGESNTALENMLSSSRTSAENNWTQKTLPQIMAGASNIHSGYTSNKIGQEYSNLQQGLTSNENQMRYGAQQSAMQQLLAALGIGGVENIVNKPGMIEGLLSGIGKM
jgi:hypothetical protein